MKHILLFVTVVILFNCKPEKEEPLPILPSSNNTGDFSAFRSIKNIQVLNPKLKYGTVKDIDRNSYATIKIGTQTWMAENLKVTHYQNGDQIEIVTDATAWSSLTSGAYSYYNNDAANNAIYGKLYNWYVATDIRGICPSGWHVPSDAEWTTLSDYLGGIDIAGGKMKSAGTTYWSDPNIGATNESGFSGLPAGAFRDDNISTLYEHVYLGENGSWWSSSESDLNSAMFRGLVRAWVAVDSHQLKKGWGLSVRCLKD